MEDSIHLLKKVVENTSPLPEKEWEEFCKIWKPCKFKKKEVITATGTTERYLYFVTEGIQRVYYFDDQNREATIVFTYPPSFGGVLDSLMLQQPSRYCYETLSSSSFLRATYHELADLMSQYPTIAKMVQIGITHALSGVLERQVELQCFSSEERFKKLLQRSPHILNIVPQKYLANYLGLDPTNFSKMVNKIRI